MQKIFDYSEDYTGEYLNQFTEAIKKSKSLNFRDPFVNETNVIPDNTLREVSKFSNEFSAILDRMLPTYWGNSCQALSTQFFAHLNARGIPAEIVIGNVIIHGTDEFDTTIENLVEDFNCPDETKPQALHAWISLGGDTLLDAALAPRLVKYYGAPPQFNDMILIGRAKEMFSRYYLRYEPMLVGSDYFAKTNPPDPMEYLERIKSIRPR